MQYFILINLVFFIAISSVLMMYRLLNMKRLFLQKTISKKIINAPFFSTLAVEELSKFILKQNQIHMEQMIKLIIENKIKLLIPQIDDQELKAKIKLMIEGKESKIIKSDNLYYLMRIWFALDKMDHTKALSLLNKRSLSINSPSLKGLYLLILSRMALFEGDMETASIKAREALKIFQKKNMVFEEGKAYFVLGMVYKISGLFDTADLMLRSALKIFQVIQAQKYEAETLGSIGMLLSLQERFDEAVFFMDRAETIFKKLKDKENECFIISQKAMNELLQNNLKSAKKLAHKALKNHRSNSGKALALEIISRIYFNDKSWKNVVKYAQLASAFYIKERNYSAYFECCYLVAEAKTNLFLNNDAEAILRDIIAKEKYHKSCFHVANAYTLLGIILLRQNKIQNAKSIFSQALTLELYNERYQGVAIDYINLALIEKKIGHTDAYIKNITTALEYVKNTDETLYNQIKLLQD